VTSRRPQMKEYLIRSVKEKPTGVGEFIFSSRRIPDVPLRWYVFHNESAEPAAILEALFDVAFREWRLKVYTIEGEQIGTESVHTYRAALGYTRAYVNDWHRFLGARVMLQDDYRAGSRRVGVVVAVLEEEVLLVRWGTSRHTTVHADDLMEARD
jgi:hypothetical protein